MKSKNDIKKFDFHCSRTLITVLHSGIRFPIHFWSIYFVVLSLGIVAFADRHNCTDLVTTSESYARHHFIDVVQSEEFMEISAKQLTRLLSDDDLNIQSEERVFEASLAWIKFDVDVRQVYKYKLI